MQIGERSSITVGVSGDDVRKFAELSRDDNPLHLDWEYAEQSIFGKRIAHGLLVSSYISAVLANQLPGPGTVYLSQSLKFQHPVFWGDVVTATVVVTEQIKPEIWRLATGVQNQQGQCVIAGEAVVKWSPA